MTRAADPPFRRAGPPPGSFFTGLVMLGLPQTDHVFDEGNALAGLSGVPVVFVHGEHDRDSEALALAEKYPGRGELVVVRGANHHFSDREEELRRSLLEALDRLADRSRGRP